MDSTRQTVPEPGQQAEPQEEHIAQHLADIARVLASSGDVERTLHDIVLLAPRSIDGCDEAGVCRRETGTRATATLVDELDRLQEDLAEGPCPEAVAGLDTVYVGDLGADVRWPAFGPAAAEHGLRSCLAYRLFAGDRTLGALQLYSRLPWAFGATGRAQGLIFAAHAGLALAAAQATADDLERAEHLKTALASREVIGQAQGILMERERITAAQAFDLLRRSSQTLNRKLRDVAEELVQTGTIPPPT